MKNKILEILENAEIDGTYYWDMFCMRQTADEILALFEGEEGTCDTCGNAVGLWCDRWDGQKHGNSTCDEWSKTHWCEINITP